MGCFKASVARYSFVLSLNRLGYYYPKFQQIHLSQRIKHVYVQTYFDLTRHGSSSGLQF